MKAEEWNKVRSLFGAILDVAPAECAASLERLHRDDPEVADEVRRLICNLEEAKSFLEPPLVPDWQHAHHEGLAATLGIGDLLASRYEIRRMLGAGGMGEVYEAWDREMRLSVTLKVLPPQLALRPDMVERFLAG